MVGCPGSSPSRTGFFPPKSIDGQGKTANHIKEGACPWPAHDSPAMQSPNPPVPHRVEREVSSNH